MYADSIFLIGAGAGFLAIFVLAWVVDLMNKVNFRNNYLYQNDADRREMLDRLQNIKNEFDILQKKTNNKFLIRKFNQVVDLIAFLRKRNMN